MKKFVFTFALAALFALNCLAQTTADSTIVAGVPTFKSDGCSMFPDGKYLACCVAHDQSYSSGGSWKMRWQADKKLYKCVRAQKGFEHKLIAPVMWLGVRAFGVSFLPTPFRWGFGRKKVSK